MPGLSVRVVHTLGQVVDGLIRLGQSPGDRSDPGERGRSHEWVGDERCREAFERVGRDQPGAFGEPSRSQDGPEARARRADCGVEVAGQVVGAELDHERWVDDGCPYTAMW
jgi:hypothetical protein